MKEGSSWVKPIDLVDVERRRKSQDLYTVYATAGNRWVVTFQEIQEQGRDQPAASKDASQPSSE